jgi:hypothetical protein
MMHCGYEPSIMDTTFGTLCGFWRMVKASFKY